MVRADLRPDDYGCRACGAPLADAPVLRRSWRVIRSGEWIGSQGEFATVRCGGGERRRMLRIVEMAPYLRDAA